jgi:hypothetical protein
MPQLDSDTFTGYSDGNLATVSAGKWTKLSGFNDLVVASEKVVGAGAFSDAAAVITSWAGSTTDQWSSWIVGGGSAFNGPTVHSDGASTFYVLEVNINGTQCQVTKCVGGSFTALAQFTGQAFGGDVVYLEWVAGVLTAKINGVSIGTHSNSDIASGKPGGRLFDLGTTNMDGWAGGDFGGGFVPHVRSLDGGMDSGMRGGIA